MASDTYHEPYDLLSTTTRDRHRGIWSLIEELEAIDWYQQRAEACGDDELRAVLIHNKNEEIEHAMMVLEWLRRTNPDIDERLQTYVNSRGPITEVEERAEKGGGGGGSGQSAGGGGKGSGQSAGGAFGSLGIGSLKGA